MLFEPVVTFWPPYWPIMMLLSPARFKPAARPTATLLLPVAVFIALSPSAVLTQCRRFEATNALAKKCVLTQCRHLAGITPAWWRIEGKRTAAETEGCKPNYKCSSAPGGISENTAI